MSQRVWCRRYGLLQVFVVLSSAMIASLSSSSVYRLVPPEVYVVFGGDLEVVFHVPANVSLPNVFVRLQGRRPRDDVWVEVTTMGLPLSTKSGTLSAACGVVEFAGRYSMTMFLQVDGPVLTEVTFTAVWPSLTLRLPDTHFALTSSVSMEIESRAACSSRLHRESLSLELYFQRLEDSGTSFAELSEAERITTANFAAMDKKHFRWKYPCEMFDLDGYYQGVLRSSTGTTLTVSNVMALTFSTSYHLSTDRPSVFPCKAGSSLRVLYTHPPCGGNDKFRMYKLVRQASGSVAAPVERVYVGEFEADPEGTKVEWACSLMENDSVGYCWVYVTVSRSGVVVEQNQLCLPSWPGAVLPQDGGWGSWTAWTTCSVTCGSGKRSRFRMCNSPRPQYGGRFCPGPSARWSYCLQTCPDLLPRSPLRSPRFDPTCYCGCTRTTRSGKIIASGRCKGLAVWTIQTPSDLRVILTFRYYKISHDQQWVKVRDGATENDDLLFFSRHAPRPNDVTSSANVMRVELMTQVVTTSPVEMAVFSLNATIPIHVLGFIATYSVTAPDKAQSPPPLLRQEESSVMESEVAIVGLVVVAMVVVAVLVFAVAQRKFWRRRKMPWYSAAKSGEENPGGLKHSASGLSAGSQTFSPGPQVQIDGAAPLTEDKGVIRKSSSGQHVASRNSSMSSMSSTGPKKGRTRAYSIPSARDGIRRAGESNPNYSNQDYTSRSPHVPSASLEDVLYNDRHIGRVSPNVGHNMSACGIHHGHFKFSPGYPVPSLFFPLTKQENLVQNPSAPKQKISKERRQKKGVSTSSLGQRRSREEPSVLHSSATSADVVPTPHTTITKAEINFTKPPPTARHLRSPTYAQMSKSSTKVRSPTGLISSHRTEPNRRHSQGYRHSLTEEIALVDSVQEIHPRQSRESSKPFSVDKETSFITPSSKMRRPTSLTENVSLKPVDKEPTNSREPTTSVELKRFKSRTPKSSPYSSGKRLATEQNQTLLPKAGQLPRSPVDEIDKGEKEDSKSSSPSKSSSLGPKTSDKTQSPSRSIVTPELEYDDFIVDDPQSCFHYEELSRLTWTGTEKLGRTRPKDAS